MLFKGLEERRNTLIDLLSTEAGINPLQDREFVGYIKGLNDLLNVSVEDISEDVND